MPDPKEWTLMFYFASDNPLAPNVVSQLKALKNAGFHQDVNVVLQFDPNTPNTPTHIFDVNGMNKIANSHYRIDHPEAPPYDFWEGNDPYIRNLVLDKLWNDSASEKPIRDKVVSYIEAKYAGVDYKLPIPQPPKPPSKKNAASSNEPGPKESLQNFLDFCVREYPAQHYMLFLIGHGLVVGNDMFLYDENAVAQSLSLRDLGDVLKGFNDEQLALVGFHSCGLSSLEVACELQGRTRFLIASQGTEFVGSWPYREIVIRILNDVILNKTGEEEIKTTIEKMFAYILRSSYDFQMAGYSFDLCMCNVRDLGFVSDEMRTLSETLMEGLRFGDFFFQERILLAHWESQSFWSESYTDLYDFCFSLNRWLRQAMPPSPAHEELVTKILDACEKLIKILTSEKRLPPDPGLVSMKPVVYAEFAGPKYQYSHGLSIYFPWSEPDNQQFWRNEYPNYKFNTEFQSKWNEFLQAYWDKTMREPIGNLARQPAHPSLTQELLEAITSHFGKRGSLAGGIFAKPIGGAGWGPTKPTGGAGFGPGPTGSAELKPVGGAGYGEMCECPTIKNYPDTTFPTSPDFFEVIKQD